MEITFLVDKEGRPPSWYHDPATGVDHITMYSGGYLWDDFTQWFTACAGKAPSRGDTSYGEMCILLYKVWYQGNLRVRVDYPLAHLHPDYQAQWFDLLVQLPKLKEVYIATNSPALINRAGHLIASDKLSEHFVVSGKLSKEQVSVLLIANGEAREYRYDSEGFLIDNWPSGYFLPNYYT